MGTPIKILVTGSRGQLGSDLVRMLSSEYDVTGVGFDTLDISNAGDVFAYLQGAKPDLVIHAAAYTDVDGCESNVGKAMAVNSMGTGHIALGCRDIDAGLIYYSTDYVFDGSSDRPYVESDSPCPLNAYGKSKLAAESIVCDVLEKSAVLRTSWLYGASGRNFVKTIVGLGKMQTAAKLAGEDFDSLKVVDDQVGSPTWTEDVVKQTQVIIEKELTGIYHASSEGQCSWYQFASEIFEGLDMDVNLVPCRTSDYPQKAVRPSMSVLENMRLKETGNNVMRNYRLALDEFLSQHGDKL